MAKTKTLGSAWLQLNVLRLSRVHFWLIAAFAALTIVTDAWNLIPAEGLGQRWGLLALVLTGVSSVWYLSRVNGKNPSFYKYLVLIIILLDLIVACYMTYLDRGMASKSVVLFVLPILSSAVLLSRRALFAAAALSTAGYTTAVLKYYTEHPGEGYKIEMYSTIIFYPALFFILTALLWIVIRSKH